MDKLYVSPEGIAASEEQIKEVIQFFNKAWEALKKAFNKVKNAIREFIKQIYKMPGYKRKAKAQMLEYYKSIATGKSNNWRKIHGVPLIRNAI